MVIQLAKDSRWREECVHIDVYRTKHLLNFSGFIDGHKIVEIERLDDEHCAVKTIGWDQPARY